VYFVVYVVVYFAPADQPDVGSFLGLIWFGDVSSLDGSQLNPAGTVLQLGAVVWLVGNIYQYVPSHYISVCCRILLSICEWS